MPIPRCELALGRYAPAVDARLRLWREARFAERLFEKDTTLWSPTLVPDLADRLGWLDLPTASAADRAALAAFVDSIQATRVVLLGMGGSSLAPEVFARLFPGGRPLTVLDTTHPAAVAAESARSAAGGTLYIVSSKSGTTIETASLFEHFLVRELRRDAVAAGSHFVAITDPGTPLAKRAAEAGFAAVFEAPAEVGGRYSALSAFGRVPAAMLGVDDERLFAAAAEMAEACRLEEENPGLALGAALGELAAAGRDKLTLLADPELAAFPDWIEQLVAESLGKIGRGVIPVAGEGEEPENARSDDRFFVALRLAGSAEESGVARRLDRARAAGHPTAQIVLGDRIEIGAEMFRWEVAVAACGALMGVQPFDQPDVQAAKVAAKRAMAGVAGGSRPPAVNGADLRAVLVAIDSWLDGLAPSDYLGIQAFLEPRSSAVAVAELRQALWRRTGGTVTAAHGPRFLHSTGQLHKGGPNIGRFLQLLDRPAADVAIPGGEHSFGQLIRAQAAGDAEALTERGRRVLALDLGEAGAAGLAPVIESLG
jgi:transaldolase / glucose-6-phosphate isomerase